ncbi:PH domain-containing protein [Candidatus Saccharibacteria bacterium]|nr:PH domain-containing protein [Candidatus Saccharibacteria bacterium]
MVHPSIIEARLGELRFRSSRWFRAEIHELQHILMDHEKIVALACGRYFGSFALLVATDQRLLLVDKRVFFMNIEDTRYDMISDIEFNSQVYSATVTIHTINKVHKFTSVKYKRQLRELTLYVQRRVMEFRNQQSVSMSNSVVSQLQPQMQHQNHMPSRPEAQSHSMPQPNPIPATPPPISTSYNYSPATSDDTIAALTEHSPEVAQMVGSAAMQATHRRPFHPYIQGSLMTRRAITDPTQPEY